MKKEYLIIGLVLMIVLSLPQNYQSNSIMNLEITPVDRALIAAATVTLRPNGDSAVVWLDSPDAGTNADDVDDTTSDGDTTYVYITGSYKKDLYTVENSAGRTEPITNLRVFVYAKHMNDKTTASTFKICVNAAEGAVKTFTSTYTWFYQDWATNPADSQAWEWSDIDAMTIGMEQQLHSAVDYHTPHVTMVYAVVTYNTEPVNVDADITNPDDTDNIYAQYRNYYLTANTSDTDGYADIDTMLIAFVYSGYDVYEIAYDEAANSFTEIKNASYIEYLSGSQVKAGNDIDLTITFRVEWVFPDISDFDIELVTNDSLSNSDTDSYDVNVDAETRLDLTSHDVYDASGTIDRGNLDSTITASGTLHYYGFATVYPDEHEIDVWVTCPDTTPSEWNATNYDDADGSFSVSVKSDDVAGTDTYTFLAVIQSAGYGGTNQLGESHTASYISDRLVSYAVWCSESDNRTAVGNNAIILYFVFQWEATGANVTGSDASAPSDTQLYYFFTGAPWSFQIQYFTDADDDGIWTHVGPSNGHEDLVKQYWFGTDNVEKAGYFWNNIHGVGPYIYKDCPTFNLTYDRMYVTDYTASDTRADFNDDVNVNVTLKYDYDETLVLDEIVWINGRATTNYGSGVYGLTTPLTMAVAGATTLNIVQIDGNNTYALTGYYAVYQNGRSITVIWDRVNIDMAANMTWCYIGYYVQVTATGTYEYDSSAFVGTIVVNTTLTANENVTFGTIGLRMYTATSMTDTAYGLTGWTTDTVSIIWDQLTVPATTYYWTQQNVWNVWIHITSGVWVFQYDNDPMSEFTDDGYASDIQFYVNGTANEYGTLDEVGNMGTTMVGPFGPTWYYANISLYWTSTCGGRLYNIYVKHFVVQVVILHSIHIEDSGMDIQDDWITFYFHTSWNNATFTIWDNITGTPVQVGYSSSEGWYQIAKPSVLGTHVYLILVNGTHSGSTSSGQVCDPTDTSDSWRWLEYNFVVNPVTLSITDLIILQNNQSVILGGFIHTPNLVLSWNVTENGVLVDSGTITLTASGNYATIYWTKSTPLLLANFTFTLAAGASSLSINGYSFVLATTTYYLTYGAGSYVEGDQLDYYYTYEEDPQKYVTFVMFIVAVVFLSIFLGGIAMWWENRKAKDRDFRLAVASGGQQ